MRLANPDAAPDLLAEPSLVLYEDPKVTPGEWEKITRQAYSGKQVGPEQVRRQPGAYILACSLWDMADLLDLEYLLGSGPVGGTYIYSTAGPTMRSRRWTWRACGTG